MTAAAIEPHAPSKGGLGLRVDALSDVYAVYREIGDVLLEQQAALRALGLPDVEYKGAGLIEGLSSLERSLAIVVEDHEKVLSGDLISQHA